MLSLLFVFAFISSPWVYCHTINRYTSTYDQKISLVCKNLDMIKKYRDSFIKKYFLVRSDKFDSVAACASLCSFFNDGLYFMKTSRFTIIILKSVEPLPPSALFRILIQTSGAISVALDTQSNNL